MNTDRSFIAGNMPGVSEILPLLIVIKLEQFDYAGATVIASSMVIASFILLLIILLSLKRCRSNTTWKVALAFD